MTPEQIKEHNEDLAKALITLAQYIAISDEKAKVKLGVQFKLRKQRLKFPVMPLDRTLKSIGTWAADEIIGVVERHQKASGTKEGQEVIDGFKNLQQNLRI